MNPHHTLRSLIGNPGLEALELRDICAADVTPTQDADAFPNDELTDREIDALYEAEMERRDRESRATFCGTPDDGDDERRCVHCGGGPNDPRHRNGFHSSEVANQHEFEGDDEPPTPPPAGSPGAIMRAAFGCYNDDDLVLAIDLIDRGKVQNVTPEQREQLLFHGTAEVLSRLDARRAA